MPRLTARGSRRDAVRVHRLEYPFPIHYLCHAAVGACYAVTGVGGLATVPVVVVIVANLLLIVAGNPINAAVDISADARTRGKSSIADAASRLGRARTVGFAAGEMATALVLAALCSWWLGRWVIVAGMALSVLLCLLYNLEPVRLKRRGFANPITLALFYGFLPALVAYQAVRPDITGPAWLVLAGITVVLVGRTLWWSLPDRAGDAAAGIRTPVVRHGARRSLAVAALVTSAGIGLLAWGIAWGYGGAWAVAAVIVTGAFLLDHLGRLVRGSERLDATRMRRRSLLSVTIADVVLLIIPLAAG